MKDIWHWSVLMFAISLTIPATVIPVSSQPVQHKAAKEKAMSADTIWNSLMEGNKRFVEGKPTARDIVARRHSLEKDQHPLVAVVSCSDSRVPPEAVFDQDLGELFVVRTAGNSADPLGIGSLEYAVEHLGTTVIVVLGHQSCGAVTAACSSKKMPSSNLEAVVRPIAMSCAARKQQQTPEDQVDFAIKDHVHKTAGDLLMQSTILKHAHDEGKLSIIEAYYSLDSGVVTRLR
jgi:carbonic anhydrase